MTSTGDGEGAEGRPDEAADPAEAPPAAGPPTDEAAAAEPEPGSSSASRRRPLDDDDVARRWKELTADLRDLESLGDLAERETLPEPRKPRPEPRPARALGPRDYVESAADEDAGEYEPEEPARLSSADPVLAIGWVAAVAPLLCLLLLVVLASPSRPLVMTLGAITLCGVGMLLWRLPTQRKDDGDGAVV